MGAHARCAADHGWRFSGDGACTAIPQALDGASQAAAAASSRACAAMHPTQARPLCCAQPRLCPDQAPSTATSSRIKKRLEAEGWKSRSALRGVRCQTGTGRSTVRGSAGRAQVRQGFVHVWGRSGPGAAAEAAAAAPLLVPELDPDAEDARWPDGSPTLDSGKPYTRDLPYGFEYLMEARARPAPLRPRPARPRRGAAPHARALPLPRLAPTVPGAPGLRSGAGGSASSGSARRSPLLAPCSHGRAARAESLRPGARPVRAPRHHRPAGGRRAGHHRADAAPGPALPLRAFARGAVGGRDDLRRAHVDVQGPIRAARARAVRHAEGARTGLTP